MTNICPVADHRRTDPGHHLDQACHRDLSLSQDHCRCLHRKRCCCHCRTSCSRCNRCRSCRSLLSNWKANMIHILGTAFHDIGRSAHLRTKNGEEPRHWSLGMPHDDLIHLFFIDSFMNGTLLWSCSWSALVQNALVIESLKHLLSRVKPWPTPCDLISTRDFL